MPSANRSGTAAEPAKPVARANHVAPTLLHVRPPVLVRVLRGHGRPARRVRRWCSRSISLSASGHSLPVRRSLRQAVLPPPPISLVRTSPARAPVIRPPWVWPSTWPAARGGTHWRCCGDTGACWPSTAHPEAIARLTTRVPDELSAYLRTGIETLEDMPLPPEMFDLINASFALPHCSREALSRAYGSASLPRCGRAGDSPGSSLAITMSGSAHPEPDVPRIFHTHAEVDRLLVGLDVERLEEVDRPGQGALWTAEALACVSRRGPQAGVRSIMPQLRLLTIIVLLSFVALDARAAEPFSRDPALLLANTTRIASPGSPGSVATWGSDAFAVVCGKVERDLLAPVVAASRLGEGRIIAFSPLGIRRCRDAQDRRNRAAHAQRDHVGDARAGRGQAANCDPRRRVVRVASGPGFRVSPSQARWARLDAASGRLRCSLPLHLKPHRWARSSGSRSLSAAAAG